MEPHRAMHSLGSLLEILSLLPLPLPQLAHMLSLKKKKKAYMMR